MDEPRFTLSAVARAAGTEPNTLRSWLQRGHWLMDIATGESLAEIQGRAHLVTLRRALHIGAAVDLIRNGVDPRRAFRVARSFVHEFPEPDGYLRGETGLYPDGWTLLVAYPDHDVGEVLWVDDGHPKKDPPDDSLRKLFFPRLEGGPQSTGSFVWLNRVDHRIRTQLPRATG